MKHILGLRCLICNEEYSVNDIDYVCPKHGNEGIVDVVYDYNYIKQTFTRQDLQNTNKYTMWRYKPLLPVASNAPEPPLAVGWTPLYHIPQLGRKIGAPNLWLKDDGRNPTASFKDRASAMALVKGRERQAKIITTASTGNAAAALAGLSASVGQKNIIFIPHTAPKAKVAQLLAYGSIVLLVEGSYDDAFELCLKAAKQFGWYNRNTAYNPYMSEGKKTAALEICEQLNFNAPDKLFVGVGDGCIIGGLHKGLKDLYVLGWIDKMPQIIGVQAAGSAYLYDAWRNKEDVLTKPAITAATAADSISAGLPRDRLKAMRAVSETGGSFVKVSDDAILAAIPALAQATGVFAEPAAAATYAGLLEAILQGLVNADDRVVLVITGNGLKDVAGAMKGTALAGIAARTVSTDIDLAEIEKLGN